MSTVNERRIRRMAREADDRYIINRTIEAFAVTDETHGSDWEVGYVQKIADLRAAEKQINKPWWRFWC